METKKEVVDRVVRHLKPSGHIVVGLAETLNGFSSRITRVMPGVYTTVGR
jgi:chemotaxis protein methyltransferase CheR